MIYFFMSLLYAQTPVQKLNLDLQKWSSHLGSDLVVATVGPQAYKLVQKASQRDRSIPITIRPVSTMGDLEPQLSKILRTEWAKCLLIVKMKGNVGAISSFGECDDSREIQVIHKSQLAAFLEEESRESNQEISSTDQNAAENTTTPKETPEDLDNDQGSDLQATDDSSPEEFNDQSITDPSELVLEDQPDAETTSATTAEAAAPSSETSSEDPSPDESKSLANEQLKSEDEAVIQNAEEQSSPSNTNQLIFIPLTRAPQWSEDQEWGAFDKSGRPISPLAFAMLTEETELEKLLRSELSNALVQQRILQFAAGLIGSGAVLRLSSARSTNSNQTISHIWTSIYLLSTTGILLYVQSLPSKSLGIKQRSLHNYLSYNDAVLIDIRRRDKLSKKNEVVEIANPNIEQDSDEDIPKEPDPNIEAQPNAAESGNGETENPPSTDLPPPEEDSAPTQETKTPEQVAPNPTSPEESK